jgi:hypothetical protein
MTPRQREHGLQRVVVRNRQTMMDLCVQVLLENLGDVDDIGVRRKLWQRTEK